MELAQSLNFRWCDVPPSLWGATMLRGDTLLWKSVIRDSRGDSSHSCASCVMPRHSTMPRHVCYYMHMPMIYLRKIFSLINALTAEKLKIGYLRTATTTSVSADHNDVTNCMNCQLHATAPARRAGVYQSQRSHQQSLISYIRSVN